MRVPSNADTLEPFRLICAGRRWETCHGVIMNMWWEHLFSIGCMCHRAHWFKGSSAECGGNKSCFLFHLSSYFSLLFVTFTTICFVNSLFRRASFSQMCQGDKDEPPPPRRNNVRATHPPWSHWVSDGVNLLDLVFIWDTTSCKRAQTVACRVFKVSELQVSPHAENSSHIPVQGSWPESSCDPLICAQRCPWPGPQEGEEVQWGLPSFAALVSRGLIFFFPAHSSALITVCTLNLTTCVGSTLIS